MNDDAAHSIVTLQKIGIEGPPALKTIVLGDAEVANYVRAFYDGRAGSVLRYVYPASPEAVAFAKLSGIPLQLPSILVRLDHVRHNLTHERGVKLSCSDADLEAITAALNRRTGAGPS